MIKWKKKKMSQMSLFPNNSHFDRESHKSELPKPIVQPPQRQSSNESEIERVYQNIVDLHRAVESKYGKEDDFSYALANIVSDVYDLLR